MHVVEFNYSACRRRGGVLNSPHFCFFFIIFILLNLERTTNSFFKQHKTLWNLPFQCFIPISAFYPHFSVLSPFQRFILISVFYPHFSVLSPFQRFIPLSVSVFSFRFRHSVSAFYPDPVDLLIGLAINISTKTKFSLFSPQPKLDISTAPVEMENLEPKIIRTI